MSAAALDAPAGEFSLSDAITKQLAESFASDEATPDFVPKSEPVAAEPEAKPEEREQKTPEPVKESTVDDFLGEESEESEVLPDADDDVPDDVKNQGEKAVAKWGDLKKATKEQAKELERLSRENAELKAKTEKTVSPDVTAEIEELRKALEDRERVIAAVSVVDSYEYQSAVSVPLRELEQEIMELADDEDHGRRIVDALLIGDRKARNARLSEEVESMSSFEQADITRIASEVDRINALGRSIREQAQVARKEIELNKLAQKGEESAKEKAARIAASETVWKNIVKKLPFVADEDGEVLPEYKDILEKGKGGITDETSLGAKAFAAYAVHLVPKMDAIMAKQKARIAELESSVKAMKGAAPSMDSSTGEPDYNPNESLSARILRLART